MPNISKTAVGRGFKRPLAWIVYQKRERFDKSLYVMQQAVSIHLGEAPLEIFSECRVFSDWGPSIERSLCLAEVGEPQQVGR